MASWMAERSWSDDAWGLIAPGGDRFVETIVEMFWYSGVIGRGTAVCNSVSIACHIGYVSWNDGSW